MRGGIAAVLQLGLALGFDARLVPLLLLTLAYLALMSVEFFAGEWLRKQPFLYMASHMAIMPLIDFYATACDWLPAGAASGQIQATVFARETQQDLPAFDPAGNEITPIINRFEFPP